MLLVTPGVRWGQVGSCGGQVRSCGGQVGSGGSQEGQVVRLDEVEKANRYELYKPVGCASLHSSNGHSDGSFCSWLTLAADRLSLSATLLK